MKIWKTILVILVSGMLVATLAACSKNSKATTATTTYTVKKGDISNTITAAGNLALAKTQDLAVNLFYPTGVKGTIGLVNVSAGDSVKTGEVLVTIDQSEWNDQIADLVSALTTAQRSLTSLQSTLMSANQSLTNLIDTSTLTKAVLNAQIGLQTAQSNLATAVSAIDFSAADAALKRAQTYYDYVNTVLRAQMGTARMVDFELTLQGARDRLAQAQTDYDNVLAGYDTTDVAQKKIQVQIAQMTLDAARQALANNPQSIALQQITVSLAQGRVDDAVKAVADAQEKLAEARVMSPLVIAPFDGFVTVVNVEGGDEVLNGTVAVTIADPNKFQANIMVSEMDIMKVRVGGDATMTLNALTGMTLPAVISQIAPTATISSGVVNYAVTVNITSTTPTGMLTSQSGNGTNRLPSGSANITGQSIASPQTFTLGSAPGASSRSSGQSSTVSAQNFQLKQGLTGTVSLIISQATNVLLVPNSAITRSGKDSTVNVLTSGGAVEKRVVQTGLSDWQNTQIVSGLNEGDTIQYSKATSTAPASTTTARPGGGAIFMGAR